MTYAEQIAADVDRLVKEGAIAEGMRQQYIDLFSKDEKAQQRFAGLLSMDRDYTNKSKANAEWKRQQEAELEAERQRFALERAALEQWERDARAEVDRLKRLEVQYPELTAKIAAYEQAIEDYGLKEQVKIPTISREDVMPTYPTQPASPASPAVPATAQGNYLTREDVGNFAQQLLSMQGTAFAIAGEHQRLFGQPLSDDIITEAMNAQQDIRQYWESKYNVQGKRAEIAQRDKEAEIARIREEERAKLMTEFATNPTKVIGNTPGAFSDPRFSKSNEVFDTFSSRAVPGESAPVAPELVPPQLAASQRVQRAAAAWSQMFTPDGVPKSGGGPTSI